MDRAKVGRYEKLEKIGEGTYGTVFKGTAPDGSLGEILRVLVILADSGQIQSSILLRKYIQLKLNY